MQHLANTTLYHSLLPVIETETRFTPFALAMTQRLTAYGFQGIFPQAESLDLAKRLTKSLVSAMDISTLRTKEGRLAEKKAALKRWDSYDQRLTLTGEDLARVITPSSLSTIFRDSIIHSWSDIPRDLSLRIAAQSPSIPAVDFNYLWLPFLRGLIEVLTQTSTPLATSRYQQLALALLNAYFDIYIGPEPSTAVDWTLNTINCGRGCGDCWQLNAFLASATSTTTGFRVGQKRRTHVQRMIEVYGLPVITYTDRSTYPETLEVKKVGSLSEEARLAWQMRRKRAAEELLKFEPGSLRALLGEEEHAKIMAKLPPLDPVGNGGSPAVSGGSIAGVKRKAENEGR